MLGADYPSVYQRLEHPEVRFDPSCTKCPLGSNQGVPSAGPDDLRAVRLIVISDYPGRYEVEFGWPQVPVSLVQQAKAAAGVKQRTKVAPQPNSGELIRQLVQELFGLDPWHEVWWTNAVRCDPNKGADQLVVSDQVIKTCNTCWGNNEFALLDRYCPRAPILAAGAKALKALQFMYGVDCPTGSINSHLRRRGLMIRQHGLVCCNNPAVYARSFSWIETNVGLNKRKQLEVRGVVDLANYMFTPLEHYKQDLLPIRDYL